MGLILQCCWFTTGKHHLGLNFSKFLPLGKQISFRSQDQEDNISIVASVSSVVNSNQESLFINEHDFSVVGEGASGSSDPVQWNCFLTKVSDKLIVDCTALAGEVEKPGTAYVSSRL